MYIDMSIRSFTLRLGIEEENALQIIKNAIPEKTDAGAIKYLIKTYKELSLRYEVELKNNKDLREENQQLKSKIQHFCAAFADLSSV